MKYYLPLLIYIASITTVSAGAVKIPVTIIEQTTELNISIDGKMDDWEALKKSGKTIELNIENKGISVQYVTGYEKKVQQLPNYDANSNQQKTATHYSAIDYFLVTSELPFESLGDIYIFASDKSYSGKPFSVVIGKTYSYPPGSPTPEGGSYSDRISIQEMSDVYNYPVSNSSFYLRKRIDQKLGFDQSRGLYIAEFKKQDAIKLSSKNGCLANNFMDLKGEVISHCMHRKHDAEFELDLSTNFQQNKPALAKAYRDLGDLMMISGCSSHSECAGLQAGHDSTNIEVSDIVTVSAGIHASNSFGGLTVNLNTNFDEIRFAAGFQRSIQATPGVGASLVAYGTGDVRAVSSGQYRYDLASIKAPTSLPTTVGVVRVTSLEDPSITGAGFQFEVGTPTIEVGWGHSWDLTDLTSDEILDFVSGYDLTESNSSSGFNPNYGGDGDNHHGNDGNSGHGGGVTDNSDGGNGVNTPWGGR